MFCLTHFINAADLTSITFYGDSDRYWEGSSIESSLNTLTATDSVLKMLKGLKMLRRFQFDFIQFDSIKANNFLKMFHIEQLTIFKSFIPNLEAEMLEKLPMLKILALNQNQITTIPEGIFRYNNELEHITLGSNKIKWLPGNLLKNLTKLLSFGVSDNEITSIPHNFFSHNKISKRYIWPRIPLNFYLKVFLRILKRWKSSNQICITIRLLKTSLPKITKLKKFGWTQKKLFSFPSNLFKSNGKLKEVQLTGKNITSVPNDLLKFNHDIEQIIIRNTQITKLPENLLKNLTKLRQFYFYDNQINSIPENFFSGNANLDTIVFSRNNISELPRTLLNGLNGMLKKIDLSINPIESIHENFFTENEELRHKIKLYIMIIIMIDKIPKMLVWVPFLIFQLSIHVYLIPEIMNCMLFFILVTQKLQFFDRITIFEFSWKQ